MLSRFLAALPMESVEALRSLCLDDMDEVCAAGSTGRMRGEVVRTSTVVSQAQTSQWLSSVGNRGTGEDCKELASAHRATRCR